MFPTVVLRVGCPSCHSAEHAAAPVGSVLLRSAELRPQAGCVGFSLQIDGLSELGKIAAQGLCFGDVRELLGIIVPLAGLCQSSELCGPLSQWLCHLLVRKGSPSYVQGRSPLMCVFPVFPALPEDRASVMEGLMLYIPFLMTKQDCWRRWLSFPLVSCSSAWGYLSWCAMLRLINGVFCIFS